MTQDLKPGEKKVVFIVGASSGIGAALAEEFARRNCRVAVGARRLDRLTELATKIKEQGGEALVLSCDVCDKSTLDLAVAEIQKTWGRLDIAVANAGFGVVGSVCNLKDSDFERQFATNIYGVIHTVQAVVPALKQTKGVVGLVGSVNGFVALPGNAPYGMSKFAVRALADALRGELCRDGIQVTHIAPGFVASEIRTVDNQGKFHAHAKDPIPQWLVMPAPQAAKVIARALVCRRSEIVVTMHGKLIVFIERHFSWIIRFIIGRGFISARKEPRKKI